MTSPPSPALRLRRPKPWQRCRARPYRTEIPLLDEPPLAQVCVYRDTIILTRRSSRGGPWTSYPISEAALRSALGRRELSSGYLPPWTLAVGIRDDQPWLVVAVPPRGVTLTRATADGADVRYALHTPPLVFAGYGTAYRLLALKEAVYPGPDTALFAAPFPNCDLDGRICWGSARPPAASASTILAALNLFLNDSRFSTHLANNKSRRFPSDVYAQYQVLGADEPYPADDLVPLDLTVRALLAGDLWSATL